MGFLRFIGRFLTFILCVVLALLTTVFLLRTGLLSALSKKGIYSSLNKVDLVEVINKIKPDVLDDMYEDLEKSEISKETVNNCLNGKSLKNLIADYIGGTVNAVVNNTSYSLNDETIELAVIDTIKEINKDKVVIEESNEVIDGITDGIKETIADLPTSKDLTDEIDANILKYIQLAFGQTATWMFLGACLVIILLMMLFLFSLYRWLFRVGIVLVMVGTLFTTLGFLTDTLIALIPEGIDATVIEIIKVLNTGFSGYMIGAGVIVLIAGILQIILGKVINKVTHRQYQEEIVLEEEKVAI